MLSFICLALAANPRCDGYRLPELTADKLGVHGGMDLVNFGTFASFCCR
jgi:hypothetical protein